MGNLTIIRDEVSAGRLRSKPEALAIIDISDAVNEIRKHRISMLARLSGLPSNPGLPAILLSHVDLTSYTQLLASLGKITTHCLAAKEVVDRLVEAKRQNEVLQSNKMAEYITSFITSRGFMVTGVSDRRSQVMSTLITTPGTKSEESWNPTSLDANFMTALLLQPHLSTRLAAPSLSPITSDDGFTGSFIDSFINLYTEAATLSDPPKDNKGKKAKYAIPNAATALGRIALIDDILNLFMDPSVLSYVCQEGAHRLPTAQNEARALSLESTGLLFHQLSHRPITVTMELYDATFEKMHQFFGIRFVLPESWKANFDAYMKPIDRSSSKERVSNLVSAWQRQADMTPRLSLSPVTVFRQILDTMDLGQYVEQLVNAEKAKPAEFNAVRDLSALQSKFDPIIMGSAPVTTTEVRLNAELLTGMTDAYRDRMTYLQNLSQPGLFLSATDAAIARSHAAAKVCPYPYNAAFPMMPLTEQGAYNMLENDWICGTNRTPATLGVRRYMIESSLFNIVGNVGLADELQTVNPNRSFDLSLARELDAMLKGGYRTPIPGSLAPQNAEIIVPNNFSPATEYDARVQVARMLGMGEPGLQNKMKSSYFREMLATYLSGAYSMVRLTYSSQTEGGKGVSLEDVRTMTANASMTAMATMSDLVIIEVIQGHGLPYGVSYDELYAQGVANDTRPFELFNDALSLGEGYFLLRLRKVPSGYSLTLDIATLNDYTSKSYHYFTPVGGFMDIPPSEGIVLTEGLAHLAAVPIANDHKNAVTILVGHQNTYYVGYLLGVFTFDPVFSLGDSEKLRLPTDQGWDGQVTDPYIKYVWYASAASELGTSEVGVEEAPEEDVATAIFKKAKEEQEKLATLQMSSGAPDESPLKEAAATLESETKMTKGVVPMMQPKPMEEEVAPKKKKKDKDSEGTDEDAEVKD